MNAEIADVVIVLMTRDQDSIESGYRPVQSLRVGSGGHQPDEGVIEEASTPAKVHDLKSVPGVSYVRSVFTYTADYPEGDPARPDGPCGEGQCERDD